MPNVIAEDNDLITQVPLVDIPSVDEARCMYHHSQRGQLQGSLFGLDPLRNRHDLILPRDQWLSITNPSPDDVFSNGKWKFV